MGTEKNYFSSQFVKFVQSFQEFIKVATRNDIMVVTTTTRGQDIKDHFADLAKSLDDRHDKHEAIFKQSRE